MKNIYYSKLIVCLLFGFVFISCDQDDSLEDAPLENTTKAEIVEESITVSEGEIPTFNLIQEDLVQNVVDNWEAIFVFPEVVINIWKSSDHSILSQNLLSFKIYSCREI